MTIFTRCAALLLALTAAVNGAETERPPNVILILSDDIGSHSLSAHGGAVQTPNLDRLAGEGVTFTNFHMASMCAPTRDMLMTGQYRIRMNGRPGLGTPFYTNHLNAAGIATGKVGKWFVGTAFDPPGRGWDEACIFVNGYRFWSPDIMVWGSQGMFAELNQPYPRVKRFTEKNRPVSGDDPHKATRLPGRFADDVMVDYLKDYITRKKGEPFHAFYSTKLIHVPHSPMPDSDPRQVEVFKEVSAVTDTGVFTEASKVLNAEGVHVDWKGERHKGIAYLDKKIGELMAHLEAEGIADDTVLIFTSDNGNSQLDKLADESVRVPGRKGGSRTGATLVPFIVHCPKRFGPARTSDELLHAVDILPTMLDLFGVEVPSEPAIDGISFAPILRGEPDAKGHDYLACNVAHFTVHMAKTRKDLGDPDLPKGGLMWVRDHDYKLYVDGRFYDLRDDLAEESWIKAGAGTPEDEAARARLAEVLQGYVDLREQKRQAADENEKQQTATNGDDA